MSSLELLIESLGNFSVKGAFLSPELLFIKVECNHMWKSHHNEQTSIASYSVKNHPQNMVTKIHNEIPATFNLTYFIYTDLKLVSRELRKTIPF